MTKLMRTLLGLALATISLAAAGQSCTPAEPRTDPGTSFSAFATLERLEVRGGRPGAQDWEWGLGTNTQQTGSFVKSYLDWVSARVLTYTLTYNGAGAGTFSVYDGATQLTTQTWNDPAKPLRTGNALKFYVKSSADSGTATVQATVATINGMPASGSVQTAGNSQFSEAAMYWYFPGMQAGFTVTGTVTLTYPGTNPPQGSRLNFIVTAGTITCQQASTPPGMYFIHVDHLNTPRLVANQSGQTVWRWDQQEPFGVNVPDENPSGLGVFDLPLRLPGQYFDKETNLHYNYFRDYDASLGRYVESDPIGLDGGLNTYAYALGNPMSFVDINGLEVRVFCRYVTGLERTRRKHCFVYVTCPQEGWERILSLFGSSPIPTAGQKSMAVPGLSSLIDDPNSSLNTNNVLISPSKNPSCDACAYEKDVLNRFLAFPAGPVFYSPLGPNSNTFANYLITSPAYGASLPAGSITGAPGLNLPPWPK